MNKDQEVVIDPKLRDLYIARQSSLKLAFKMLFPVSLWNSKKVIDLAETLTEYVFLGNDSDEA